MVFDGSLSQRGHDDNLLDTAGNSLLYCILNHGLIEQRQHLLRLGLGRGQKPGA